MIIYPLKRLISNHLKVLLVAEADRPGRRARKHPLFRRGVPGLPAAHQDVCAVYPVTAAGKKPPNSFS